MHCVKMSESEQKQKPYVDMSRKEIEAVAPTGKRGSLKDGTDGAHKLSHELAKGILGHTPGPKATVTAPDIVEKLQSPENIRIKSAEGNRKTDRENDAAILEKYVAGENLSPAEGRRANQAYKGGTAVSGDNETLQHITEKLGDMQVSTGKPGRPTKVKNL
eukprot:Em0001g2123a